MTWINKLDSFDEVKAWYDKTKPLVSKHHTLEQDVRPIGNRNRKWERIVRVDPNTYALSCGGYADPVFTWGGSDEKRKEFPITADEVARLSPIVWRKHKDGTETVTIRNGAGDWNHNSTYSFLQRALPRELWFRQTRVGKQFIYNRSQGQTVHLPKTKSVPRHVYEYHTENAKKQKVDYWSGRYMKSFVANDDGLSVTFKREENGTFTLVGEPHKVMVDRTRMNKELKGSFKADIAGLFEASMALYPLMREQLNWNFRHQTNVELKEIAEQHKIKGYQPSFGDLFKWTKPELIQAILKDPEHPMRHGLNIAAMFAINYAADDFGNNRHDDYDNDEDREKARNKAVRARFNKWISKLGGFTVTTREEK